MTSNNKISNLINSQVPFFVRDDHHQFILFMQKYYEFLEQTDGLVDAKNNILSFKDIDYLTRDSNPTNLEQQLQDKLYATFLRLFPKDIKMDKSLLLKHAKEFYSSRGTEKSIRFLLNAIYGQEGVNFYYPKKDILKASDGKWYVQKSLKITDLQINSISNNNISGLEKFVSTTITGNTSGATAIVERVDKFYEGGTQVEELVISNIRGTFTNGEQVFTLFNENDSVKTAVANVFGGILNTITIENAGAGYNVGDPVIIESSIGSGANVQVARVSSGNIASITVLEGGAGYQNNDYLLISGGGGSGANGYISAVVPDGKVHPNSYNIYYSTINLEANTSIGNTIYSNLVPSITDPANNWIANSLSSFVYGNTGPSKAIVINTRGSGFTSTPSIGVVANTRIEELGILGRMVINNGGLGYQVNDSIIITNVLFGLGTGAAGNVTNVQANGMITEVAWRPVTGHITGGAGYSLDYLPLANVVSANANAYGAVISVTELLGTGGDYLISNTTLGAIERVIILNRGSGYLTPPTLNLKTTGDGTATANATVIEGVFTYPGRYLNDDGMLSSYNFLEDRDYYQQFSYVLQLQTSIGKYRQALKDLVHPSGMKLFGEYHVEDNAENYSSSINVESLKRDTRTKKSYLIANNVVINYTSHGFTNADSVYVEFISGNIANYAANSSTYTANSIYRVANVINSNAFTIYSGKYLPGSMNVNTLVGETGPSDIYMKEDGYNLFLIGTTGDRVYDFKLSRQYDITTGSLNKRGPTISTVEGSPSGLTFKPDGTIMYICGTTAHLIIQYNMSEAWNVNTATIGLTFNVANALSVTNPQSVQLSRDGNYMYFVDSGTDIIYQLSLTQAWNVNTASYLTQKSILAFDSAFTGVYFNANGTSMFLGGQQNDRIKEFRLSTAWNVNTATIYANSSSFNAFTPGMSGIAFANNGSMLYLTDTTYDLIHQLPMREAWNVNTAFNGTTTTGNVMIGLVV